MGAVTNFEELLEAQKRADKLIGKAKRAGWGKAFAAGAFSAIVSIVGTTWKVRGYVDELEREHAEQTKAIEYLKVRLPEVEKVAIEARGDAQRTERLIMAHLGGWPTGVK